jgi:acetate kinase
MARLTVSDSSQQAPRQNDSLIFVVNSGSSSLKFGVYRKGSDDEEALLTGSADGIGDPNGTLKVRSASGETLTKRDGVLESQVQALAVITDVVREHLLADPVAVGHRIVHGGPDIIDHQCVTQRLIEQLRAATHFAPLHIPQALLLINSVQSLFPSAKQFACFDDVFHRNMPEVAARLPIPERYYAAGIRRYGFHGLSYESLVHSLGDPFPERAILAHLGNGSSLCALRNRVSIDTTMGLTPTGGIPMGSRSGDIDPGVFIHLLRTERTDADTLEKLFNNQSGILALSRRQKKDFKTLEQSARAGDAHAALAVDAFVIAVRKMIGAYAALLGGVDLIVFTGGVGEHSEYVRASSTRGLEFMGITAEKIRIVPAREELQIARHCRGLLKYHPDG